MLFDNQITSNQSRRNEDEEEEEEEMSSSSSSLLGSSKKMVATQEELVEARVPLAYRDECAHLLIPLHKCRQSELFLPWKCEDQRHSYEKCQYELVMERILQIQRIRENQQQQPLLKTPNSNIPLVPKTANGS